MLLHFQLQVGNKCVGLFVVFLTDTGAIVDPQCLGPPIFTETLRILKSSNPNLTAAAEEISAEAVFRE